MSYRNQPMLTQRLTATGKANTIQIMPNVLIIADGKRVWVLKERVELVAH